MSQELTLFGPELERAFQEHPASVAKAKRERPLRAVKARVDRDGRLICPFRGCENEADCLGRTGWTCVEHMGAEQ